MAQAIGIDIGRGYSNGYSEYGGETYECMFPSMISIGRRISNINKSIIDPIYINVSNRNYFVGELARKEGYQRLANLTDDKTSQVVEILIVSVLNSIAKENEVSIMLGVPNKLFRRSIKNMIIDKYKNKKYLIKDKINNSLKTVTIVDINIFREADASLMWYTRNLSFIDKPIGLVNIGFRTTEFCYYDKEFEYVDRFSRSEELGNKDVLQNISNEISKSNDSIMLDLYDIDVSDDYNDLKDINYDMFTQQIKTHIENLWINHKMMDIFIAGGTTRHLNNLNHIVIPNAEMSVARGLWYVLNEMGV